MHEYFPALDIITLLHVRVIVNHSHSITSYFISYISCGFMFSPLRFVCFVVQIVNFHERQRVAMVTSTLFYTARNATGLLQLVNFTGLLQLVNKL